MEPGVINIQVRVAIARARAQIASLQAQMRGLKTETAAASVISPVGKRSFADMTKSGNQMQWVGRQLQYNFTLPLLLAAGAATKFQLDQEKAMTHVSKVYGDTAQAAQYWGQNTGKWMKGASSATEQAGMVFDAELAALEKNFDALSVKYAVQKKEVMEVAGAWAAAGVSGKALAESVDNTMIAAAIGDFSSTKATEALISIQAQYNLSAGEMKQTLADLNAIENATATDMQGLITSMAKSGSAAAAAGVPIQQLAAMTAAITPAAGSAAQAGNALKTILSRINKPTQEAAAAMMDLGINSDSMTWKALGGAEKLQVMSKAFNKLDDSQQASNASSIAGIYQYNRLIQLLKDMGRKTGYYNAALKATETPQKSMNTLQKELSTILESNPKRLQRMGVALQNSMADIIQPLIPYVIYLAGAVADLVKGFGRLPDGIQKVALWMAVLLIAMPLLLRYMGSVRTLGVVLRTGFVGMAQALGLMTTATQYQTLVDGESVIMTETKRRGLFGLIAMMLRVPFVLFGNLAGAGFGAASKAFTWMFGLMFSGASKLVTGLLPYLAGFVVSWARILTGGFTSQTSAFFMAEASATAITAAGTKSRLSMIAIGAARSLAIEAKTAAERVFVATSGMQSEITVVAMSMSERIALIQAAAAREMGIARALNAARFGLEAGASASRLALTAEATTISTAMVVRGQTAEVVATAAGSTAKVGIIGRLAVMLTGLYATMGARLKIIWASTIAFLTSPAAIMSALTGLVSVIGGIGAAVVGAITSPFVIAALAVVGILFAFRNQISQIWNNIVQYFRDSGDLGKVFEWMAGGAVSAFNMLPQGIQNAMVAVVKIVRAAALAVYEWFSYINPFAHHSPSLVENVTFGMQNVLKSFSSLKNIKQYTDSAYGDLKKFGDAAAGIMAKSNAMEAGADRATLASSGSSGVLKYYDDLQGRLSEMTPIYKRMGDAIDQLAKRDIVARREMDDAIFANEYAQKQYQLQMLDTEKTAGTSIDNIKSKLDELRAQQELLSGTKADLQNAGAGSEITKYYDDQLAALKGQEGALQDSATQMNSIQDKMDALQKAGERLNLEKALKFDQVDHRLEQMREQYDLVGTTISDITNSISAAVRAQESLTQSAERERDARKQAADASKQASAAGAGAGSTKGMAGLEAGADLPKVTGKGLPVRTDFASQVKGINDLTDQAIKDSSDLFASINPFKSLGGWFKKTWGGTVKPAIQGAGDWAKNFFGTIFDGVKLPKSVTSTGNFLGNAFDPDKMKAGLENGLAAIKKVIDLFWPDIKRIFQSGWDGLKSIWSDVGPELVKFADLWPPIKDAISGIWTILKPVLGALALAMLSLAKIWASTIGHIIGPALELLGSLIASALAILRGAIRIIAGVIKVIVGILTLDPKMILTGFGDIGKGIFEIFTGLFRALGAIFKGAFSILLGLVQGVVGGIFGFFKWLYSLLPQGVHTMVDAIIGAFKFLAQIPQWIWNNVLKPVFDFFANFWMTYIMPVVDVWWNLLLVPLAIVAQLGIWFWQYVLKPVLDFFGSLWSKVVAFLKTWWAGIMSALSALKGMGQWVWNNALKPVINFFGRGIQNVIGVAAGAWGKIQSAFNGLKSMGKWVYDNALKPLWDKFKEIFSSIGGWIKNNISKIINPMKSMVNGVIGAINKMIDGLLMLNKLPGIDFKIGHISPIKMASGGAIPNKRVGGGFATQGARAIVGEGKPNHPEYVIPTDPTYRNRAMSLFQSLGTKLGVIENKRDMALDNTQGAMNQKGIPMFFGGGILDSIKSVAGGVKKVASNVGSTVINVGGQAFDWAKGAAGNIASRIYTPVGKIVDGMISKIGTELRGGAKNAHAQAKDVVFGTDKYMAELRKEIAGKWVKPLAGGYSVGGGIGSYKGHNGQDFPTPSGSKVMAVSGGRVTSSRDIRGAGSQGYASYGRVVEIAHADGVKSLYAHNSSRGVNTGAKVAAGQRIANSGSTGNSTGPHLHLSMWQNGSLKAPLSFLRSKGVKLAAGAVVRATPGGTDATIGEGRNDEAVIPLPRNWKSGEGVGGGETTYNFYGDLSFPNVKTADDAEDFIRNLQAITGGKK